MTRQQILAGMNQVKFHHLILSASSH